MAVQSDISSHQCRCACSAGCDLDVQCDDTRLLMQTNHKCSELESLAKLNEEYTRQNVIMVGEGYVPHLLLWVMCLSL